MLLDVVPVVLEHSNQVTPSLDPGNVLVDSSPQYVPEMFSTVHVRRQGRPGHHPDSILLNELVPSGGMRWSALGQHTAFDIWCVHLTGVF